MAHARHMRLGRAAHRPHRRTQVGDELAAWVCALIGLHWHLVPRDASIMIDDREAGYMVAPASLEIRQRLVAAAAAYGVSTDVDWNPMGNAKTAQLADKG
ncbi:hypothetical protein [Methylorubrum extorquens]